MSEVNCQMRKEVIGNATLYQGDCRDILPDLEMVDAVVTDPPYGVNFQGKNTKNVSRKKQGYISEDDHKPALECFELWNTKRVVLTPGTRNLFDYPKPDDIGAIYYPAGAGLGKWGFTCSQPVLFYGKCPYLQKVLGHRPNSIISYEVAEKNGHPCPKPIRVMEWMVTKASLRKETILDPFMGSGTTGVACMNLDRHFIGIEKEPEYFEIACKRISDAESQGNLFGRERTKPEQVELPLAV